VATSTLTRKGQTTVPRGIREHLGLKPGDTLESVTGADGGVRLRPGGFGLPISPGC
jgi:AbrB family looped-hinge helix DNA binding protein